MTRSRHAIETVNQKRSAMQGLARLRRARPAPITGLDALLANQVLFYDDTERFTASVSTLCDELEQRIEKGTTATTAATPTDRQATKNSSPPIEPRDSRTANADQAKRPLLPPGPCGW